MGRETRPSPHAAPTVPCDAAHFVAFIRTAVPRPSALPCFLPPRETDGPLTSPPPCSAAAPQVAAWPHLPSATRFLLLCTPHPFFLWARRQLPQSIIAINLSRSSRLRAIVCLGTAVSFQAVRGYTRVAGASSGGSTHSERHHDAPNAPRSRVVSSHSAAVLLLLACYKVLFLCQSFSS